jgi:hypothetical protein
MKRLAIAALAIMLAGCTNNDINAPNGSVTATFSLRTVNGSPLPYTFTNGPTVESDVLSLFNDGTYSDAAQLGDGTVAVEQGYYGNNNGAFTFTDYTNGNAYHGSLSGSVMTEISGNNTYVYQQN